MRHPLTIPRRRLLLAMSSSARRPSQSRYPRGREAGCRRPLGRGSGRGEPPGARPRPRAWRLRRPWRRRPPVMMDLQNSPWMPREMNPIVCAAQDLLTKMSVMGHKAICKFTPYDIIGFVAGRINFESPLGSYFYLPE